jgi:hypothetical protein
MAESPQQQMVLRNLAALTIQRFLGRCSRPARDQHKVDLEPMGGDSRAFARSERDGGALRPWHVDERGGRDTTAQGIPWCAEPHAPLKADVEPGAVEDDDDDDDDDWSMDVSDAAVMQRQHAHCAARRPPHSLLPCCEHVRTCARATQRGCVALAPRWWLGWAHGRLCGIVLAGGSRDRLSGALVCVVWGLVHAARCALSAACMVCGADDDAPDEADRAQRCCCRP